MADLFDVFVSYAHADGPWVRVLAQNLERLGLRVFLDIWEIRPGDVVIQRLEHGLRASRSGVLVVSPAAMSSSWVTEEYAALLRGAVTRRQRLIPVLVGTAELPEFAANRLYVDFTSATDDGYKERVQQLAAALRGEAPPRPEKGGQLQPPPPFPQRRAQ